VKEAEHVLMAVVEAREGEGFDDVGKAHLLDRGVLFVEDEDVGVGVDARAPLFLGD
jgi:hypothetical protein